jgi:FkbM family methyltransferase
MSWRTHRLVAAARRWSRAVGVNRLLARLRSGTGYEGVFHHALMTALRKGICVWDVGANVGFYTSRFAEAVGPEGKVFAFEPSPFNRERLRKAVEPYGNVTVIPAALGERDGTASFRQGEDSLGASSRVLDGPAPGGQEDGSEVRMVRGDALLSSGAVSAPQVIKIDTEGFELEVLRGLEGFLRSATLETLCVEVHSALLAERGLKDGPRQVERILKDAGFRVLWVDWSHIVASRPSP